MEDREEFCDDWEEDQAGIETVLEKFVLDPNSTDFCFSSFSITVVISSSVTRIFIKCLMRFISWIPIIICTMRIITSAWSRSIINLPTFTFGLKSCQLLCCIHNPSSKCLIVSHSEPLTWTDKLTTPLCYRYILLCIVLVWLSKP